MSDVDLFGAPIPEPPPPKPKRKAPKARPRPPAVPWEEDPLSWTFRPAYVVDTEIGKVVGIVGWGDERDQMAHDRLPRALRDFLNYSAVQWDARQVERAIPLWGAKLVLKHLQMMEGMAVAQREEMGHECPV